ncbi:aldose epimerase family protein [Oceanobacillus neutriphilus]|uniref:Aldose 1-epimerase n=1 Tax=Oceanobacillus neutriphilus TaxID=531815 RepID=A0ABQ2NPY9_9BACI|nr:aldose epimerase family protein [Oceanobacillus neutriphilus]GGP07759.1 aldose 1-epimerase [Oceanobacillus neutriphilus]
MNIIENQMTNNIKTYSLTNNSGMIVNVLNYGGVITDIIVPDREGAMENIVLGYPKLEDYETDPFYFGAIIGRVAGRIQDSLFSINDNNYRLEKNEGNHHLHSGGFGFHQVIWNVEPFLKDEIAGLKLTHRSVNEEGGYPGTVDVEVTYSLHADNQFRIKYRATTDKTTPLSLTNHTYFNLAGNAKHTVENHLVTMDSRKVLPLDSALIPTGEIWNAKGTPFDFRKGRKLRDGLLSQHDQNQIVGGGYDHFFQFDHSDQSNVTVFDENSGRIMQVKTDQPGMVMYTANSLPYGISLKGSMSEPYLGVCFETQAPSASLHHAGLPKILLEPDEIYHKETVFTFST